ncbi:molecular chaperone [Ningiella sp. W23]|uniref:fimbrial biogenesis chaperone n=1 Tax=Ningiella sp. W23 TaxID=3023715 RepID=UPI00375843E5
MKKSILVFVLCMFHASSMANLMIAPTYGFFQDNERSKQINLINSTDEPRTYRISWSDKAQLPDGGYEELDLGAYRYSAANYLRFAPRQVRLMPGERQTIKILKRNTSMLAPGDYRSHLTFTALPDSGDYNPDDDVSGMRLKLNTVINYSIPVVMRVGDEAPQAQIVNAELVRGTNRNGGLKVTLNRTGNTGTLGRIQAYILDQKGQPSKQVGLLNGANFFRDGNQIVFNMDLNTRLKNSDKVLLTYDDAVTRQVYDKKMIN